MSCLISFELSKTSATVLTLCGTLKNILLVIISVLIWGTIITLSQLVGYTIGLCGLLSYSLGWESILKLLKTTVDIWQEVVFEYNLEGWRGTLLTFLGSLAVFFYVRYITNSLT